MKHLLRALLVMAVACDIDGSKGSSDDDTATPGDSGSDGGDTNDGSGLSDCAGEYSGTYNGTDSGDVNATLLAKGALVITFVSDGSGVGVEGTADVDEDGSVDGEAQGVTMTGTFDFSTCTAAGTWEGVGGGTWALEPV